MEWLADNFWYIVGVVAVYAVWWFLGWLLDLYRTKSTLENENKQLKQEITTLNIEISNIKKQISSGLNFKPEKAYLFHINKLKHNLKESHLRNHSIQMERAKDNAKNAEAIGILGEEIDRLKAIEHEQSSIQLNSLLPLTDLVYNTMCSDLTPFSNVFSERINLNDNDIRTRILKSFNEGDSWSFSNFEIRAIVQSGNNVYHTTLTSCTCPDCKFRKNEPKYLGCKHSFRLAAYFSILHSLSDEKYAINKKDLENTLKKHKP